MQKYGDSVGLKHKTDEPIVARVTLHRPGKIPIDVREIKVRFVKMDHINPLAGFNFYIDFIFAFTGSVERDPCYDSFQLTIKMKT